MALLQRNRITQEDKQRFVRALEEQDQDYLSLADMLAIQRSTARSVIARYLHEGRIKVQPRGGRCNALFDAEMIRFLQKIVDEDCTLSLDTWPRKDV